MPRRSNKAVVPAAQPRCAVEDPRIVSACAEVMTDVAGGSTVKKACAAHGITPYQFHRHVISTKDTREAWELAKQLRAHCLFDEGVALAEKLRDSEWGREDSSAVRALDRAITGFFYAAGRLSPREYGERSVNTAPIAIQINTSLNLDPNAPPAPSESNVYTIQAAVPLDQTLNAPEPSARRPKAK